MSCKKCPHHVRHGQLDKDGKNFIFDDLCGLLHKQSIDIPLVKKTRGRGRPMVDQLVKRKSLPKGSSTKCPHFPFDQDFDYFHCQTYQGHFTSNGIKNDVVPTKDFQYSEQLAGISVTDMELL